MPKRFRPTRLPIAVAALAALAIPISGCGTSSTDTERGRVLFVQKCGGCHKLAQAGTAPGVGPDLDAAFAAARATGQNEATIEGVVEGQIDNPRPGNENPMVSMPPDLVTGQDAKDVAAYVALYAGVPGAAPPKVPGGPGAQVFASAGCGGCHTLAEVKAGGTTGPNLDQVLAGQSAATIDESIVDPNAKITPGYPPGVMPGDYETSLTPQELKDLVSYLLSSTAGQGGGGKAAKSG
jgi:mono/diheme cytochrome c family protein